MNVTIQGVDITLTPEQLDKLRSSLPPQKIQDKIKTLKDVYKHLGVNREDVIPFKSPKNKSQRSTNAKVDIEHISQALNEGWIPDFSNTSQYKHYPYFQKLVSGWVVRDYTSGYGFASLGFGFYYKNSDLALYAGKTFLDVYTDYIP
jgi:hypothetical protein